MRNSKQKEDHVQTQLKKVLQVLKLSICQNQKEIIRIL